MTGQRRCSSRNSGLIGCVHPPPLRPDASHATMPLSITKTSTPSRASHQPADSPVAPPPTMTTDAPRVSLILFAIDLVVIGGAPCDGVVLRRFPVRHVL